MRSWRPLFDIYQSRLNGHALFVRIDLAARQYAPLVTHQCRLTVSTALCNPHADGLRTTEEAPAIFALEDVLVAALERELDAVFVYAAVLNGRQLWTFYIPENARDKVEPTVTACCSPSYALQTRLFDDPEWSGYLKTYPNVRTMHLITNRRILRELSSRGDPLTPARPIDHRVYLPSEKAAHEATAALSKRGFVMAAPPRLSDERRGWAVDFSRSESCLPPKPDQWTSEILQIVDPLGGKYDGWGCVVVKE
jgi:hypothetical protein